MTRGRSNIVWTKDSDSSLHVGRMISEVYKVSRHRKPGHILRDPRDERLLEKSGKEDIVLPSVFHARGIKFYA